MPSENSFFSDPPSTRNSETQLQQDKIQAACLETIALTDRARQAPDDATRAGLEASLTGLIHHQQALENELARLQLSPRRPSSESLTALWWQVAELETLIYGLHQALHPPQP